MGKHTKINIATRYKPFSHIPGASCIIPFTNWGVCAFPARIEVHNFFEKKLSIDLILTGPVENFTLEQDLEKGLCRIFGHAQEGYFEFHLFYDFAEKCVALQYDRGDGLAVVIEGKKIELQPSETLDLFDFDAGVSKMPHREKISLGVHKKQDMDLIWRRFNLLELMPLLFYSAQSVICDVCNPLKGELHDEKSFSDFLQVGFDSIMTPIREDRFFRGLSYEKIGEKVSPIVRIKHFHDSFRSLFIEEATKQVSLLPNLFRPFVSGRLIGAKTQYALIDFSWRKGRLRTVIFHGLCDGVINIKWPKGVKGFRLDQVTENRSDLSQIPLLEGKKTVVDKFIY